MMGKCIEGWFVSYLGSRGGRGRSLEKEKRVNIDERIYSTGYVFNCFCF